MNQSFDAFLYLDECSVRHKVCDLPLDFLACGEAFFNAIPRIGLELFQSQRDTLLVLVNFEDNDLKAITGFDRLARMAETSPGHVCNVQKTINPVQIKKRTKISDILNSTLYLVAGTDITKKLLATLTPLGFYEFTAAYDYVLAIFIDLNNLEVIRVADELS